MRHDVKKYLRDVELAIEKIHAFLPADYDFTAYEKDVKTQYAIERALAIIGEAVYQILKTEPTIAIFLTLRKLPKPAISLFMLTIRWTTSRFGVF